MAAPYELADTVPAQMLTAALARAKAERGLSTRQLAKLLNINQAVVISHMALGRMPVPIDRAEQLAEALGMDPAEFLSAVVRQRHPDVRWDILSAPSAAEGEVILGLATDLEQIAGMPIARLSAEHRAVLREVVASAQPTRRWISEHEMPVVADLRRLRPGIREHGLENVDREKIEEALR